MSHWIWPAWKNAVIVLIATAPADLVLSLRKEGFDFAVAVSSLGQGQTRRAAGSEAHRLDLHGGSNSHPAETKWPAHRAAAPDRKSTRLNSSHTVISYA